MDTGYLSNDNHAYSDDFANVNFNEYEYADNHAIIDRYCITYFYNPLNHPHINDLIDNYDADYRSSSKYPSGTLITVGFVSFSNRKV